MTKEAVFSALDARDAIVDASVLDLFAGTGALAIEALSRGAASAVLVERERAALDAITTNLATVGAAAARLERRDVHTFLAGPPPREAPFDLVFVDPPYETDDATVTTVCAALLAPGWLSPRAVVAVERPVRHTVAAPEGLTSGWTRTFGDTLVTFLWP